MKMIMSIRAAGHQEKEELSWRVSPPGLWSGGRIRDMG